VETTYDLYKDKDSSQGSDTPVMGQSNSIDKSKTTDIRARYFTGVLTNPNDVIMLEHIMTKSLHCKDQMVNPGDVMVLTEQGAFDKDGCYNIVVKYLELVDKKDAS
jgi:hypothetical protein